MKEYYVLEEMIEISTKTFSYFGADMTRKDGFTKVSALRSKTEKDKMCGAIDCYQQSKIEEKICKPQYLETQNYLNDIFGRTFQFFILLLSILLVAVLMVFIRAFIDYFHDYNMIMSGYDDQIGILFGVVIFLSMLISLNWKSIDLQSFCLMNSGEQLCQENSMKNNIHCLNIYGLDQTNTSTNRIDNQTNVMARFDGFSGFFNITESAFGF